MYGVFIINDVLIFLNLVYVFVYFFFLICSNSYLKCKVDENIGEYIIGIKN